MSYLVMLLNLPYRVTFNTTRQLILRTFLIINLLNRETKLKSDFQEE